MAGLVRRWRHRTQRGAVPTDGDDFEYWDFRAQAFGRRAVLNLGHPSGEEGEVTRRQTGHLLPLLRARLRGDESRVLDFGCGVGRFTPTLAGLVGGTALGVDPTARLLELAPPAPGVEYRLMTGGRIPEADGAVDVIWCAIVLGCITGEEPLRLAAREMLRVLRPGGLLFLAENTSRKKSGPKFIFRSVDEYRDLFAPVPLECVSSYEDLGETISVLAGRTAKTPGSDPWPS